MIQLFPHVKGSVTARKTEVPAVPGQKLPVVLFNTPSTAFKSLLNFTSQKYVK